jgi:hypothetical protein
MIINAANLAALISRDYYFFTDLPIEASHGV